MQFWSRFTIYFRRPFLQVAGGVGGIVLQFFARLLYFALGAVLILLRTGGEADQCGGGECKFHLFSR